MCSDANNVAAVRQDTKGGEGGRGGAVVRYSPYKTVLCRTQNKVEKYCSVHKSTRRRKKESGMDKRNERAPQPVWLASTMTLHLGVLSPASLLDLVFAHSSGQPPYAQKNG